MAWAKPRANAIKLNTDGAFSNSTGEARCGGLIRDSNGQWKGGFVMKIGQCSIMKAKLWAICKGLELA